MNKPNQTKTCTCIPLRSHQQVDDTFRLKMDELVKEEQWIKGRALEETERLERLLETFANSFREGNQGFSHQQQVGMIAHPLDSHLVSLLLIFKS